MHYSERHKIASGAAMTFVSTGTAILVGMGQLHLAVTYLSSTDAGIWLLLLTLASYLTLFDFGFGPTLSREIGMVLGSECNAEEKRIQIRCVIDSTKMILFRIAAAVFIIGSVVAACSLVYGIEVPLDILVTITIFATGALFNVYGNIGFAALYGFGYVATEKSVRTAFLIFWYVITLASLKNGGGLITIAIGWLLYSVLARASTFFILRLKHPWIEAGRRRASWQTVRAMGISSINYALTSLGALLILQSGNPIIAATLGVTYIAPYEAVTKLVTALMTFSILLATASAPFISRSAAANDHYSTARLILQNVKFGMSAIVCSALFVGAFGREVIGWWLGDAFFPGTDVLVILLIVAVLEVHHVILATAVMASGKTPFAILAVTAGVVNILIGLLIAPSIGLLGVALGTLIAQLSTNNWYVPWYALRHFKISLGRYMQEALLPIMYFSGICAATAIILKMYFRNTTPTLVPFIINLTIYGCVVLSSIFFLVLSKDERASASRWLTSINFR